MKKFRIIEAKTAGDIYKAFYKEYLYNEVHKEYDSDIDDLVRAAGGYTDRYTEEGYQMEFQKIDLKSREYIDVCHDIRDPLLYISVTLDDYTDPNYPGCILSKSIDLCFYEFDISRIGIDDNNGKKRLLIKLPLPHGYVHNGFISLLIEEV